MIEFAEAATAASRGAARAEEREFAMSRSHSSARQAANRPAEPAIQSNKSFAAGRPAGLTSKSDWTTA